jgi:hypothetical protein
VNELIAIVGPMIHIAAWIVTARLLYLRWMADWKKDKIARARLLDNEHPDAIAAMICCFLFWPFVVVWLIVTAEPEE